MATNLMKSLSSITDAGCISCANISNKQLSNNAKMKFWGTFVFSLTYDQSIAGFHRF